VTKPSPLQVAICGAGVAGLSAANLLHASGCHVVVFDQLDEPTPLGSGLILQPTGLAVLGKLGLHEKAERTGARINRLYGKTTATNRIVLDVHYKNLNSDAYGVAIHRAALFNILHGAVQKLGVTLEPNRVVQSVSHSAAGKHAIHFTDGQKADGFDLIIDALGVNSCLSPRGDKTLAYGALWANVPFDRNNGFKPDALEQRYRKASEMAGVLPIGSAPDGSGESAAFFWSLKHEDFETWRGAGLHVWKEKVLALWPQIETLLQHITHPDDLVMAQYAHHTLSHPIAGHIAHIGDSYHAASPQLGQGANMALLDAWALAKALREYDDLDKALGEYAASRRWHVRLYQTMSWLFTPVYQSDGFISPVLRDAVAAPLSRITPAPYLLASMVAGTLGGPIKRLGLDRP